jgi:hypothetical protein
LKSKVYVTHFVARFLSALVVKAEDQGTGADPERSNASVLKAYNAIVEPLSAVAGGESGDPVKAMYHFAGKVLKWAADYLKD